MKSTLTTLALATTALLPVLIDSAFKGLILLCLAALAVLFMRRSSASTRHIVWVSTLAALLLLPFLSLTLPKWRVLPEWMKTQETVVNPVAVFAEDPLEMSDVYPTTMAPTSLLEAEHALSVDLASAFNAWGSVVAVWAVGLSVLLARLALGAGRLWVLERRGADPGESISKQVREIAVQFEIGREVKVLLGEKQSMPMTWGVLHPRVQLPAEAVDWDEARLRSVLLHELAHVKRFDTLTQLLVRFSCAVHWFNPLVWFAARRIELERERSCDDLVLAYGVRPSDYAENLMEIVTQNSGGLSPSGGLAMARPSTLESRLRFILNDRLNRQSLNRGMLGLLALLLAVVIFPMAMLQAAEEAPEEDVVAVEEAAVAEGPSVFLDSDTGTIVLTGDVVITESPSGELQEVHVGRKTPLREIAGGVARGETKAQEAHAKLVANEKQRLVEAERVLAEARETLKELERSEVVVTEDLLLQKKRLREVQQELVAMKAGGLGSKHPAIAAATAVRDSVASELNRSFPGNEELILRGELSRKVRTLERLREVYVDEHPQVQRAMAEVAQLQTDVTKARLEHDAREAGVPMALLSEMEHPEKWAGIGVMLSTDASGYSKIRDLVTGAPAEKSGALKAGDLITAIENQESKEWLDLKHFKLAAVVKALRGNEGQEVALKITRGKGERHQVRLKREFLVLAENRPGNTMEFAEDTPLREVTETIDKASGPVELRKSRPDEAAQLKRTPNTEQSVPFLGEIPMVGDLFKARADESAESPRVALRGDAMPEVVAEKPVPAQEVSWVPLKFAEAEEVVRLITALGLKDVTLVADARTNSLLYKGSSASKITFEDLVEKLDVPVATKSGDADH